MNTSKNSHNNLNEGGKKVINNPNITEIIANNAHTHPSQYEEKLDDGLRTKEQPLATKDDNVDTDKALEAGDK